MEQFFSFSKASQGLVFGAGRGIGFGIVQSLVEDTDVVVHAVYRDKNRSAELLEFQKKNSNRVVLHLCEPASEIDLIGLAKKFDSIDFIINSIGFLHEKENKIHPERKIEDCESHNLVELYKVNTLISVSIYKVFKSLFKKKEPTLFAAVSAKVGSISDNNLGGWYGYRMSKAALNMFLKNLAIESSRRASNVSVVSVHPGTTITELSKPFIGSTSYKLHTAKDTGANIIKVLDNTKTGKEAHFLSWDGQTISW